MHRVTCSLAALVSIFLVSTSVSASACDLSCWLHQAHSHCHSVGSAPTGKDDMSMSDMDMGPSHMEGSTDSDTLMRAVPGHSMAMSPQQEMVAERLVHATKPDLRTSGMPGHSKSMSSCTHEACSQISVSSSPPRPDHSQPNSLRWITLSITSPVNLRTGFHCIGPGTPPPKTLAAAILTTTLRI